MHCNHRWNIKTGATRSGKTYLDYIVIPKRILKCTDNGLIVLLGNTKGTLERNILEPMRGIWSPSLVGNIGSDNTVRIFGRKCYALGADKINQVSKLQGAAFAYCYGDEITTWHEDVFQMLKSRLSCADSCFDGTCNPASPQHWFKKFLDSDADIYQQSYTIDDNPFLTADFVAHLKCEYAGTVYYNRFILGEWAIAEGLVYPAFGAQHIVQNLPRCCTHPDEAHGRYFISIDYGTKNPFSAGLWCLANGVATRIAEYYYDGRKSGCTPRTDEEHYAALETLTRRTVTLYDGSVVQSTYPIEAMIIDPSAASMMECIRRHGRFVVRGAKNDVLSGIGVTAALLSAEKIKIHCACADCIREFKSYRWDEKAAEDKVIKENDHAMDDARYFCYTVLRREFRMENWSADV